RCETATSWPAAGSRWSTCGRPPAARTCAEEDCPESLHRDRPSANPGFASWSLSRASAPGDGAVRSAPVPSTAPEAARPPRRRRDMAVAPDERCEAGLRWVDIIVLPVVVAGGGRR